MTAFRLDGTKGERSPYKMVTVSLLASFLVLLGVSGLLRYRTDVVGVGPENGFERRLGDWPPCLPANATISVATPIINAFAQVVLVPALQSPDNIAVIPEQEQDHIWVDKIILRDFLVKTLDIKTAAPDVNSVTVNVKDFGLTVSETRFRYTYLGIRCYGHFTATLNETDITGKLAFTLLPESRWNATFTQLTFDWGTLAIQHALDSKACGMAQSVIELFTGQMDKYIADKVQKKLDEDGKSKATETLNSLFEKVNVRALSPPIMTPDNLTVMLDGTPAPLGCDPQPPATQLPTLVNRDIAAHTTVRDINNVLNNMAQRRMLRLEDHLPDSMNTSLLADVLPEVYELCPECLMYMLVQTYTPPVAVFLPTNTLTLTVRDVVVGLYVIPSTEEERGALHAAAAARTPSQAEKAKLVNYHLGLQRVRTTSWREDIPVLALSCGATFGVQNMTFEGGRSLHYRVLDVTDFNVKVAASSIGDINVQEVEQTTMKAVNTFAVPLLNSHSPYKIPFFLRKAVLNMTLFNADAGVNIGFMDALMNAVAHSRG